MVPLEAIEEGLLARSVASQVKLLLLTVPGGNGEHPHQSGQGGGQAESIEGGDQRFGVRVTLELTPPQLCANLLVVVDLAVIANRPTAVWGVHRLRAGRGKVQDREASVTQRQLRAGPHTVGVGAAM